MGRPLPRRISNDAVSHYPPSGRVARNERGGLSDIPAVSGDDHRNRPPRASEPCPYPHLTAGLVPAERMTGELQERDEQRFRPPPGLVPAGPCLTVLPQNHRSAGTRPAGAGSWFGREGSSSVVFPPGQARRKSKMMWVKLPGPDLGPRHPPRCVYSPKQCILPSVVERYKQAPAAMSPSYAGGVFRRGNSASVRPVVAETAQSSAPLRPSKAARGSSAGITSGGPATNSLSPASTIARTRIGI